MKFTPRMPESNVNVTPTSPLREFFVLLSAAVGIVVGIYFLLGLAVALFVPRIPVEIEQNMAGAFINATPLSNDFPEKVQELQVLLTTLQTQCSKLPYQFRIHLQKNPQANAVALPGGNIILFSGLLDRIETEAELSFVLSHEMGHYANRDHLRVLGRTLIFMALSAAVFGPDSSVGDLLAQSLNITELGFSRKQETRADEFALNVLECRYGHVGGAVDLIEKLTTNKDTELLGHYFSTHPQSLERISHIKAYSRSHNFSTTPSTRLP